MYKHVQRFAAWLRLDALDLDLTLACRVGEAAGPLGPDHWVGLLRPVDFAGGLVKLAAALRSSGAAFLREEGDGCLLPARLVQGDDRRAPQRLSALEAVVHRYPTSVGVDKVARDVCGSFHALGLFKLSRLWECCVVTAYIDRIRNGMHSRQHKYSGGGEYNAHGDGCCIS